MKLATFALAVAHVYAGDLTAELIQENMIEYFEMFAGKDGQVTRFTTT